MAGKNKIERGFRFLFDDSGGTPRDLTPGIVPNSFNGAGMQFDEAQMEGASDMVKKAMANQAASPISFQSYLDDTATTGVFTVLMGMLGKAGTATIQFGSSGSAPTGGDPEFEGEYTYLGYTMGMNGGRAIMSHNFAPAPGTDPAWGTVS